MNSPPADGQHISLLALRTSGGGQATLALAPDPEKRRRALAHGRGHALWYVERVLDERVRDVVLALGRAWTNEGGLKAQEAADARDALQGLQRGLAPDALLTRLRCFPVHQRVPRWPSHLRRGRAREGSLWPFDAELAAFAAGRRSLCKRDGLDDRERGEEEQWLEAAGLGVKTVAGAEGWTVFGASDATRLDRALEAESALRGGPSEADGAAEWLGRALGYPTCCVEAFRRLGARDDLTLASVLLPRLPHPPASPLSAWLAGPLALVSHAPCSLACRPTLDLAKATLAALESARPGFASRWVRLARRILSVDDEGRCVALLAEGDLAETARVVAASELTPPAARSVAVVRPFPLEGERLALEDGVLVTTHRRWRAALAADHRADEAGSPVANA
jgi:hypothetical protein